ncbi:MAG: glycosyltransferase [Anaerolineae bacterium]|nr:glycosyltransferase [Anaerolineae bacterium]
MRKKVGYVVHTFPRLTLTFVLREILALEAMGVEVVVFSLKHPDQTLVHPEFQQMVAPILYVPKWNQSLKSSLMTAVRLLSFCRYPHRLARIALFILQNRDKAVLYNFFQAIWMARQMQHLGITHLHAHAATVETLVAMFAAQLSGKSYSFTAHASDIFPRQEYLTEKLNDARFAVAISEYNRTFLIEHHGDEDIGHKIHVVHCGVDLKQYPPLETAARSNPFTMITVARLAEQKGHHILLKALSILRSQGREFCCIVVGEGPQFDALQTMAKTEGLADAVDFKGGQTTQTVRMLLQQADLFVLPCVRTENNMMDGIPVALMEAMALGVPVVSTYLSGIPELIENEKSGFLVPEKDAAALACVIAQIMDNRFELAPIRAAARLKIEQAFAAETNAAALDQLFNRYLFSE